MIIDHTHPEYLELRKKSGKGKYNGCYYYSKEIVENIIPRVTTNRDWNTVGKDIAGMHDGMIVFLHDNSTPWNYAWLKKYKDLILVCSSRYTQNSVKFSGCTILLPMSIDTEYVKQFKVDKKTKDTCFVGNVWVRENLTTRDIPDKVDFFSSMPREKLLKEVTKYRRALAIDRCAQECQVLGCELLPLETRYGCDSTEVLDNRGAAKILQAELDKIEGGKMPKEYRVMKLGNSFQIQQQDGDKWETVGEFDNLDSAKEMVRDLRSQQ